MKKLALWSFSAAAMMFFNGCALWQNDCQKIQQPAVTAVKAAAGDIIFDGEADEKFWQKVPAYDLVRCDISHTLPPREKAAILKDGLEKGQVKFAYDDKYFYAAAVLQDNDIVAVSPAAYQFLGDCFKIVLTQEDAVFGWNFISVPNGMGVALCSCPDGLYQTYKEQKNYGKLDGFEIKCKLKGTLNMQDDRDKGWSTEMRIPLTALAQKGMVPQDANKWRILAVRMNYSAYNYFVQSSVFPRQAAFNFYLREYFSPVIFR